MIELFQFQISVPLLWVTAGILIFGTEFLFPSDVSIWSGAACLIVSLLIWIGLLKPNDYSWQFSWFAIFTVVLICAWFFGIKRYTKFGSNTVDKYRDSSLANLRGTVKDKIFPGKPGSVDLYNSYHGIKNWKAESSVELDSGEEIQVVEADGIKLIVEKYMDTKK